MEKLTNRIIIDPKVMHGKPIIMGTGIPVELVLGSLAGGTEIEDICKEYRLERMDVLAARYYANRISSHEEVILLTA